MTPKQSPSVYRTELISLLNEGIDILERHWPSGDERISVGLDRDYAHALEILTTIAAAFQAAVDHRYHRALAPDVDPDSHELAHDRFPFAASPANADHLAAHRRALAGLLRATPDFLPQSAANTLAEALEAANAGDVPSLFRPTASRGRGKSKREAEKSQFARSMPLHVYYRAGYHNETLARAREHYADLLGISELRSVSGWNMNASADDLKAARALGERHRTAATSANQILDVPKLTDADFAAAYRDLIARQSK